MEEKRKIELAVKLLMGFATIKGVKLYPVETMDIKLEQLSEEIHADKPFLKNFVKEVLTYMLMRAFTDYHHEPELAEQFRRVLYEAQGDEVAIKLLKCKHGLHLKKADNLLLNEIAQRVKSSKEELIEFIQEL